MKYNIEKLLKYMPKKVRDMYFHTQIDLEKPVDPKIIFKIAETKEELYQSYVLLHDRYVESGLQAPLDSRMRITPYHVLPSTLVLVAVRNKKVLATVTVIQDSFLGLPSGKLYDLSKVKVDGKNCSEISALAICSDYKGQLFLPLVKFIYAVGTKYLNVDRFVATIREGIAVDVYESFFCFKKIEPEFKEYAFGNNERVGGLYLDFASSWDQHKNYEGNDKGKKLLKYFLNYNDEKFVFNFEQKERQKMMDYNLFKYFFVERSNVLQEMKEEELIFLLSIYNHLPHSQHIRDALKLKKTNHTNKKMSEYVEFEDKIKLAS